LPPSPVTTPIVRGSAGRCRRFCGANSPSASSVLRSRSSCASRSPSPATRSAVIAKENDGAQVVVAPHRAGHGAVAVAQLEVDLRAAHAQVPHLAEELHARALAQEVAQLRGVGAHAVGARQRAAVDPCGTRLRLGHRAAKSRFVPGVGTRTPPICGGAYAGDST
jgi:hypothetical protein